MDGETAGMAEGEILSPKSDYKAYAVLKHLSADERTRLEYEYREKARLDEHGRLAHVMDVGLEKGRAEGEHNRAVDTARKMLARGMEIEVVADLSGLSISEVDVIRRGE